MKISYALVLTLAVVAPGTTQGFFFAQLLNSCFGGSTCGIFGLSILVHVRTPGLNECTERCVFFPTFGVQCGSCTDGYNIYYDYEGVTSIDTAVFEDARERWRSVIVGDLTDISSQGLRTMNGCSFPSVIDDLFICTVYGNIDGVGGTLGQAGPTYWRTSNGLPVAGEMMFDTADINSLRSGGTLDTVILHEMGHILGIGTRWAALGLLGGGSTCPYLGAQATAEFQSISGCRVAVPTETDGGPGTACSHWDEDCMDTELMTGVSETGATPLSRITIGTLFDLGYKVDFSAADSYRKSDLNPNCQCRRRTAEVEFFGLNETAPRRRLSDKAYNEAWNYGMSILLERAKIYESSTSMQDSSENSDVVYVGHLVISIFVEENGKGYDVIVTNL